MPSTTLGLLASASVILALQFWHANYLDRTLPKRRKLPVWLRGRADYKRRTALRMHAYYQIFLTVLLLLIAIKQDMNPGPRTNLEMVIAFTGVLLMFALLQVINWWLLMRWFRKGEPPLR
ncbi:hypothetical protein [Paraurantiacibacter namhicola]|uniref:Uncharacterized protein n=1 Tax=Paraurantiacibacter namhicola TaxID=645517 RepID=A0A1C7DA97_9SPHN|nr:hypothetical protein [Paraurantiacibacter namhicola]ANU08302.1 hypothetical protein A6F65_02013 [Paraurantiacibacter namhicola]